MIKKILLAILFLFITLIAVFFVGQYVSYVNDRDPYKTFLLPRLELAIEEITTLTSEKTEMNLKMRIKNKLPFSFSADSLQYSIFINDTEVMKSRYKNSIVLKGNDSNWVVLPVTIFNHDLISVLKINEREHIDSVEYRLQASFFSGFFLKRKFNLNIKRLLPLIYIPEVIAQHIEIDSMNFSRAAVRLHLAIKNENIFPLKAKSIAYEFSIEDTKWIIGMITGLTDIKATDTTYLSIPMRISFKEMSKTLFDLMKKGNNVNYKLHLTCMIDAESNMIKNSKVTLESSGSVKSLVKAAKN